MKPTSCEFKSQNRQEGTARHRTGQTAKWLLLQLPGMGRLLREKQAQQHLYSERASVCAADLYVVMCVSCCLEWEGTGKYVTCGPSRKVLNASEALQKATERRR